MSEAEHEDLENQFLNSSFSANPLEIQKKYVIIYLTSAPGIRWVFMCLEHMNIRDAEG